jgi:mRNA interferase YafQ
MRALRTSTRFDKDLRLAKRRNLNLKKLVAITDKLRAGETLPAANRDHPLKGEWQGWRDCHIAPDWLLIYRLTRDEVELARTGTHADLFG